jgi:hypothetical protein
MTSAISTVGLTYDGSDLQSSDLSLYLKVVRGLWETPSVRGDDTVVPALAGRAEGSRVNDLLKIELRGWVRADPDLDSDHEDAVDSVQASLLLLRTLFASDRERADLVATLRDGTTRTVSARPLNMITTEIVEGWWYNLSVELEGYDDWADEGS